MNETWYRILRRLFDLIILLLFVVILIPDQWYQTRSVDRPHTQTEAMVQHASSVESARDLPGSLPQDDAPSAPEVVASAEAPQAPTEPVSEDQPAVDAALPAIPPSEPVIETPEPAAAPSEPVVEAPAAKVLPETKKVTAPEAPWWLQVGVFQNEEGVQQYVTKLKQANIHYKVEKLGKMRVVKVGPVSPSQLESMTRRLKSLGMTNWVKTR